MGDVSASFNNISYGSCLGTNSGSLRFTSSGLHWRASSGSKTVDAARDAVTSASWQRTTKGCSLIIGTEDRTHVFLGFRDSDVATVREAVDKTLGATLSEAQMAVSGRNWGSARVESSHLSFSIDNKPTVQLSLLDVAEAAVEGGNDVRLAFSADGVMPRMDALTEIIFHVPDDSKDFPAPDEETNPARALLAIVRGANPDVDAGTAGEAVAEFEETRVLAPRGNFKVEMHLSFMRLVGAQDFVIRYSAVSRIFILPKNPMSQTAVVVSLDPPARRGNTYYPHVLFQFPTDEELELDLNIDPAALEAKRAKCDGKLDAKYDGKSFDVFAKVLRGLSASRIIKPSAFRASDGTSYSLQCSYKADQGRLFPLERGFFYIDKPPLLVMYDDIASVQFARQAQDAASRSSKTFDLHVYTKAGPEHQFRNIAREEWSNLLDFMEAKKIRIEDLAQAKAGPGAMPTTLRQLDQDLGLDEDDDSDEEDADFDAGAAGGSGDESSGGDDSDESDVELVPEEVEKKKGGKKEKKKEKKEKGQKKRGREDDDEGGKKKKRKKKDKNAPKKGMSAYLYFCQAKRDEVKAENPGASLGETSKILGERWKAMSADEKQEYEERATTDKSRYEREMREYKDKMVGSEGEGDAEEEEGASEGDD